MGFFSRLFASADKAEQESFWHCPSCGEEYRRDLGHCLSCETALISDGVKRALDREKAEAIAARGTTIKHGDQLQTLEQGPLGEMKRHAALLAQAAIPSELVADDPNVGGCCGGPQLFLQIRPCDLEAAAKILHRDFESSTALASHELVGMDRVVDGNSAINSCPACGAFIGTGGSSCHECGLCFSA